MALPFNTSDITYSVLNAFTQYVTGSWTITGILLLTFIILTFVVLRMPLEYTVFLVIPLDLVMMAYTSDYLTFGSILLVYAGIIIAKNFFFS